MEEEVVSYSLRTDLAIEAKDMYVKTKQMDKRAIEGVQSDTYTEKGIRISHVHIDDVGGKVLGKKSGHYVTIYTDGVKNQDTTSQKKAAEILANELGKLLQKNNVSEKARGLVVGLGNWNVTPDALGPMTTEKILVTSHLFELQYEMVSEGYREVGALTPGVMGVTGIETSDIIGSVVETFKPDFVIAVDALASRSIDRINETIQLSDSGIHPGSGVGNKRKELSKETLGVPVVAIGVPTVVDAVTITADTIDYVLKHLGNEWKNKDRPFQALIPGGFSFGKTNLKETDMPSLEKRKAFLGMIGTLSEGEKRDLIKEVLTPTGQNMIVTPKEVDGFMKDMAHLLASGINAALHERVDVRNFSAYTR